MSKTENPARRKSGRLRRFLIVLGIVVVALLVKFTMHLVLPRNFRGTGEILPLTLPHGKFQTLYYNRGATPKGVVIVGTGDGGWSYWEEKVSRHLSEKGYAVGGWDCRKFADTRSYDQAELSAGFREAVKAVRKRSGAADGCPVWYFGWSTGAEQSVAAAAVPDRPSGLAGVLLAAPGKVGRYGITESDLLGMEPSGPGAFALEDLAPGLTGLKVVQFVAGLDPLDDTTWQRGLGDVPVRSLELPACLHDMGGAGEEFLGKLDEAMAWTRSTPQK